MHTCTKFGPNRSVGSGVSACKQTVVYITFRGSGGNVGVVQRQGCPLWARTQSHSVD
nr:unnamed protein product [Callosobruchus analis]